MKSIIMERAKKGKFVLIAEIGVNYYDIAKKMNISVIDAAKLMVKEAKDAGIHAVKFQTYKADTLAAKNSPSYWDITEENTKSQYELFKKFDSFSYQEYKEIASYCEKIGIEFLSTPFDIESADYLYDLMNVYKISSSDLSNLPFVSYIAKKNKPILLSIGASNEEEIDKTIKMICQYNTQPIVLLHCVLEYPTPYEHANLNKIISLKSKYPDLIIGYSDHTKPDKNGDIIKTAYNLGAIVIEKHFTLDKTLKGNDHYHAMDQEDAKKFIKGIEFIDSIRGSYELKYLDSELEARKNARRSLVAACDIKSGQVIKEKMLTFKRPGTGISPSEIGNVIGKIAIKDIKEDTILQYEMLK
ncbi:N-acetylneuraminate synthase family protein [Garciella nitratireducens]|uniref:N-acetylneuraminate synthase n=1 Tax=Garciella nitratireducens DSM 15102 TaxID=1121911 RepID=A0A1T4LST0_9FIRM|nr:N-acetylneuraminate synthase family protein [Garciella nitratireducens]RBP38693.1 N-acetylneuraminate synthase [Garciella nitratireducens]SJZ57763.1 N-acetylneuraminate synthase [Garciella nitratireducens DSM 15102]